MKTKKFDVAWCIITYVVAVILFVVYCHVNKESMCDSTAMARTLPAGANAMLFTLANFLTGAFLISQKENRGKIAKSFAVYALLTTSLWLILPTAAGRMAGVILFLMIGFMHIRMANPKDIFPKDVLEEIEANREQDRLSATHYKYILWGILSLAAIFLV